MKVTFPVLLDTVSVLLQLRGGSELLRRQEWRTRSDRQGLEARGRGTWRRGRVSSQESLRLCRDTQNRKVARATEPENLESREAVIEEGPGAQDIPRGLSA